MSTLQHVGLNGMRCGWPQPCEISKSPDPNAAARERDEAMNIEFTATGIEVSPVAPYKIEESRLADKVCDPQRIMACFERIMAGECSLLTVANAPKEPQICNPALL